MPPKSAKAPRFQPKDMVLAKMTGFPAWPSFVMPSDMIPDPILKAKKKATNTCVIFIPDGDFYWMNEKSLEALSPEKLKTKIDKIPKDKLKAKGKKKSGRTSNVVEALVAASGLQFDAFMAELESAKQALENNASNDEEDEDEDIQNVEEEIDRISESLAPDLDAKEAPQEPTNDHDVDEANGTDHDNLSTRARRKLTRSSEDLPVKSTVRLRRRNGKLHDVDEQLSDTNVESNTEQNETEVSELRDDSQTDVSKESEKSTASRKRMRSDHEEEPDLVFNSAGKIACVEGKPTDSEDHLAKKKVPEGRGNSPKPVSDSDRQHQLWLCRIKLQRSLIQRNQPVTPKDPKSFPPPTVDELLMARIILQKLADFPVTVDLLRDTKIHKVLKCIIKNEDLEYPDSFRLHEKCGELLEKWHKLIEGLKLPRNVKTESRIGSSAPEDSEISGLEFKPTLEKSDAGKINV